MKPFNERLRNLRKSRKLTQQELAKSLNYEKQAISNWENDRKNPSQQALNQLSSFFGVSLDFLVGNSSNLFDINSIDPKTPEAKLTISISKNLVKLSEKELQVIDQLVKTMIDE